MFHFFALSIEQTCPDLHYITYTTDYILYNWVCDEYKNLEHLLVLIKDKSPPIYKYFFFKLLTINKQQIRSLRQKS